MKEGQSREVGSKESQREGVDERREASAIKGRLIRGGFGGAEIFSNKVKVTERGGKGLRWIAEKEFDGTAADLNIIYRQRKDTFNA